MEKIADTKLVSIIIPVHNAEKYLKECLESICNQTLKEIEIIVVDDESTDKSKDIIEKFCLKDKRIRYFYQKKSNAGQARNLGIKYSSGEYLSFVDSDDFIKPTMLEEAYVSAKRYDSDIVIWNSNFLDEKSKDIYTPGHVLKTDLFLNKNCVKHDEFSKNVFKFTTPAPWNKLYKKKFIEEINIQFQSLNNTNDLGFVYTCLGSAKVISWVNKPLYIYRINIGSSTQNTKSKDPYNFVEALEYAKSELIRIGTYDDVKNSFFKAYVDFCSWNLKDDAFKNVSSEIRKDILKRLKLEDYLDESGKIIKDYSLDNQENKNNVNCYLKKINIDLDNPKVSIIVPFCNDENNIEECINSIFRQSMTDFEVLCINYGSKDNSINKILKLSKIDSRIKVIESDKDELESARNKGIKLAKGKYIYFLDSNDVAISNLLEAVTKYMDENELDICYFNGLCFTDNEYLEFNNNIRYSYYNNFSKNNQVMSGNELFCELQKEDMFEIEPFVCMVNRAFIIENDLYFDKTDNYFALKSILCAAKTMKINELLYLRRYKESNITTSKIGIENVTEYCYSLKNILDFLENYDSYPELEKFLDSFLNSIWTTINNYYLLLEEKERRTLIQNNDIDSELIKKIIKNSTLKKKIKAKIDKRIINKNRLNYEKRVLRLNEKGIKRILFGSYYCLKDNGLIYTIKKSLLSN